MQSKRFNPINYGFEWVDDGTEYGWYDFDSKKAHKEAQGARNSEAKKLRKEGYKVRCYTNSGQLLSRGGIGSGKPHIELFVNVYCLTVQS